MKIHRSLMSAVLLFLFTACSQLGIVQPKSFDQQLAYSLGTVSAARVSAAQALDAKTISKADAEEVLKITDQARSLLDSARAASKVGDIQTAQAKLALATSVLTEVQKYLNARAKT